MKTVLINACDAGSTGKIMFGIASVLRTNGYEIYTFSSSRGAVNPDVQNHIYFDNRFDYYIHMIFGAFSGLETSFSFLATLRLIRAIKRIQPDIIHIHITHGWYLNHRLFFNYLHKTNAKIVWTLHDCWSFTGRCPHFLITGCDKWKTGCNNCLYNKKLYPPSYIFDCSNLQWKFKKKMFTGIKNLTLVTPSKWLAGLVKQSYLKDYPVKVINNGIDLKVFNPVENDFRSKHNLGDKYIVLGVAFGWGERKGLDVFIELAKRLNENFQIVLVGTNESVDNILPKNIISIHRTNNANELAGIYSVADVLINPTREDTYPTVNMEAIACGTPVITFNTGGSPEIVDEKTGCVVKCDDIETLEKEIIRVCTEKPFTKEDCIEKAKSFDMNDKFKEYVDLYKET